MARSYYSDYVAHMMRFYLLSKQRPGLIESKVEKANVSACEEVLGGFTKEEGELIKELYSCEYIPQNVEKISREKHLKTSYIWKLLADFERKTARIRGLV